MKKGFFLWIKTTLQGTNISPQNGILKMIFLFPRWDMLIPWRILLQTQRCKKTFQSLQLCKNLSGFEPRALSCDPLGVEPRYMTGRDMIWKKTVGNKISRADEIWRLPKWIPNWIFQTSLHKHLSFLDGFMRVGEKKDSSIFQFPSKFPVPPWTFRLDLSCHYQGSVFGVWTHFVLCFFCCSPRNRHY